MLYIITLNNENRDKFSIYRIIINSNISSLYFKYELWKKKKCSTVNNNEQIYSMKRLSIKFI